MPATNRDIALRAFSTPEWRCVADALFLATGVFLSVMDFKECDRLSGEARCGFCHVTTDLSGPAPLTCFDTCPSPESGPSRIMCRAGLPTLVAPVLRGDSVIAHLVLGGFVTSTRERRRLYETLLARGISSDSARLSIKALAVVARRQAEGYLQMALASATMVTTTTADRMSAAERVEELRLFVSAGQQVVTTERLDASTLGGIAEEAVAIVGGEAGAVLRARGTLLEVVARTQSWRGAVGALVPRESTAAGRAYSTRRTVVSPGGRADTTTLAMPLVIGQRMLGVLEARLPSAAMPIAQDRVARLDRFGRFIAIALERDDERLMVERAMAGYAQLNELAAALGGQTDIDGVSRLVTSVLDKAFTYEVAGLVLTSYGRDHADVVVCGDIANEDLTGVLAEVVGRDTSRYPFDTVRTVTHRGQIVDAVGAGREWATAVVELTHGELDIGYLFVATSDGTRYNAQDHALLDGIAAHAGAAFGRAALFGRFRDDYAKTIAALSATLDAGERMPAGHSSRVMDYSMLIGEELGLELEDIETLRFAGLLHDIGKTGVPEEILLKPSRLSAEEFARVRSHSEMGASIVDQIDFLKLLTPIILHHHERWDGAGYPMGLSGESIPLMARILAVADSFDAMTTTRPYTDRLPFATARFELEAGAGTQFDPRMIAALFEALDRQALVGATGLLAPREAQGRPELPA